MHKLYIMTDSLEGLSGLVVSKIGIKSQAVTSVWVRQAKVGCSNLFICLFIYLGFYVAFNTVQVISRRVVGRAEETSTYSWSRFCTVNCQPTASNYQLF